MNSIVTKFVGTLLHPWQTMGVLKLEGDDASLKPSMIYIIVMGFIAGLITSIYEYFMPTLALPGTTKATAWIATPLMPVVAFIGSFIGAFVIWGLINGWLKGTLPEYKTAYRIEALMATFSPLSALLAPIPKVGQYLSILVNIWGTIVLIQGIIIIRETPKVRTWVVCLCLLTFLFTVGLMVRVAAQHQMQTGNFGAFGAGSDANFDTAAPTDDLGETSDNLDKELKDLSEKAKAGGKSDVAGTASDVTTQPKK